MFIKNLDPKFYKYNPEVLERSHFYINMKNGSMVSIPFIQYSILDLMIIVLENREQSDLEFTHYIDKVYGYKII